MVGSSDGGAVVGGGGISLLGGASMVVCVDACGSSGSVSEKLARPARAISQGTHVIAPTRRGRSEESLPHNPAMLIPSTRLCGTHHRLANSLWRCAYSTQKTSPPLRILFAGSDEFSAVSLRALHKEQQENPELIASLDVLCREDGKTGRKRNILKEGMALTIPLFSYPPSANCAPIP